jgi:hypothetical protein
MATDVSKMHETRFKPQLEIKNFLLDPIILLKLPVSHFGLFSPCKD